MMREFLTANRSVLIARCKAKVAQRTVPSLTDKELTSGIPLFLDQLIKTLEIEEALDPMASREDSGKADGLNSGSFQIGEDAARHGRELSERGFTVDQVVHDYGDLCQAVTGLALEQRTSLETSEFQTLNRCLDDAIAGAVTSYNFQKNLISVDAQADILNQRLGSFAHELRNLLMTATLAFTALKAGNVGLTGATSGLLDASLVGLRALVDRSLFEVRMAAAMPIQRILFSLADFIADVKLSADLQAQLEGCELTVAAVDRRLAIEADRDMLSSAVGNLLQNAFKFTRSHSTISLRAYAADDRILIDVEDQCGGLPAGMAEKMFHPFTQGSEHKGGLGLGLTIAQRSIIANEGTLSVRDLPGSGCLFTIDLPRHSMPTVAFRQ